MPFGIKKIKGYLEAKSQIHHGGDNKTGSETLFRRQEYLIGNNFTSIPIIHGNAFRGILRREIMADLCNTLGLGYKDSENTIQLNKDVYHALFSGGTLHEVAEKDSGKINLEFKKQIMDLVPPLSLFGTAFGNQILSGSLQISHLLPLCSELKNEYLPDDIPEKYQNRLNLSVYEFIDYMFQTRKDELREREDDEQAIQMLIKYEIMKPGTIFYTEIKLVDYNELELSCLARTLELWSRNPHIGGNSSVGLGKVAPNFDLNTTSDLYIEFLDKNKKEIMLFLKQL